MSALPSQASGRKVLVPRLPCLARPACCRSCRWAEHWLQAWKGGRCSGQLQDSAFSTTLLSVCVPLWAPPAQRGLLNDVQQQRWAGSKASPSPPVGRRRTPGLVAPAQGSLAHKVPLYGLVCGRQMILKFQNQRQVIFIHGRAEMLLFSILENKP